MISVAEALEHLFALAPAPRVEEVPLAQAGGRVLTHPLSAKRAQPPFPASAMDGYAVRDADVTAGATLNVIGEAAAGRGFGGSVGAGEAVRVFTGAPIPNGADRVVIQEDVTVAGTVITPAAKLDAGPYIRPRGTDFDEGFTVAPPLRLGAPELALLAAMNVARVPVAARPEVAVIATGDELVMPGEVPRPDQIVSSNGFALAEMIRNARGLPRLLPIAKDDRDSLLTAFDLAQGADLVITIGGASVGDHDLVAAVAEELEMERAFYKIAMRPGKPLMAGRLRGSVMVGLPGNPVSSIVCGAIFISPLLAAMQGLPATAASRRRADLAKPLPPNGPREHYMRARFDGGRITAFDRQDSALLSVLAQANALLIRPPGDPARETGETVEYVPL